jgi:hypothetical protein
VLAAGVQPSGNLLWRPAAAQTIQGGSPARRVQVGAELAAGMARLALEPLNSTLRGVGGVAGDSSATSAELAADGGWMDPHGLGYGSSALAGSVKSLNQHEGGVG